MQACKNNKLLLTVSLRITTNTGERWLAHKGKGYGKSMDTVLVDARHMSGSWKPLGLSVHVGGRQTVGDFMKAAAGTGVYKWYNPNKNCWGAADAIIALAKKGY